MNKLNNFLLRPIFQSKLALYLGVVFAATTMVAPSTNAQDAMGGSGDILPITSVSELSDVKPSDWAFQALQSLAERYQCLQGYGDRTYRGNSALSRYEFAFNLNSCLNQINDLLAKQTAEFVNKNDLPTMSRLQEEFASELASIRSRVDNLEKRTTKIENQQFSPTTKLNGEAIFSLAGATGASSGGKDANIVLNNRVRLNLLTSFSGKDLLITGLQMHNFGGAGANLGSTLGYADGVLGSFSNVRLSYEPQFPTLNPANLSPSGNNSVSLYKLLYIFPGAKNVTLFAGTNVEASDAYPSITPFASEGQGALSRFASLNPVVRVSGGTSETGQAAAVGFIWQLSDKVNLRAFYGSVNASIPSNLNPTGVIGATPLGSGFFGGSTIVSTQLTLQPAPNVDVGLNYANSYHQINILGTGLSRQDIGAIPGFTGGVNLNSLGGTVTWRISPKVAFSTYGAGIFADAAGGSSSATFTSWMTGLHFNDLFQKGNTAGLIFGQPLTRTTGNSATPYHLESYYNFRVNDNISITPGVFFIFNPEGVSNSSTVTVGVVRTTFSF